MYQVLEQLQTTFSLQDQVHHSLMVGMVNNNSHINLQILTTAINHGPMLILDINHGLMLILDINHDQMLTIINVIKVSTVQRSNAVSIIQMAET